MGNELSSTLEDYLRVILEFQQKKRFARVSDIAATVGVAKSAVTAALQSLSSKGLIHYQAYQPVTLTDEGKRQAEEILLRHRIILDFLEDVLAIEGDEAESIACDMEHAIKPPALEKFVCFLAFVGTRSRRGRDWMKDFRCFTKSGADGLTCKECIQEYLEKVRSQTDSLTSDNR